jgi:peptidoglycan-associated lipoprotein
MSTIRAGLLVVAAALLAAGCSSTKLDEKPAPVVDAKPAAARPSAPPAPPSVTTVEAPSAMMGDPLNDPKGILAHRSVYFEFDRSGINDSDVATVEAHGRYLVDHRARTVRIEGNCDERGGREYNLALGQRRADSVRDRLKSLGVAGDRVETTSFGKEKPRNLGHDEAAWAENRRADIVYK